MRIRTRLNYSTLQHSNRQFSFWRRNSFQHSLKLRIILSMKLHCQGQKWESKWKGSGFVVMEFILFLPFVFDESLFGVNVNRDENILVADHDSLRVIDKKRKYDWTTSKINQFTWHVETCWCGQSVWMKKLWFLIVLDLKKRVVIFDKKGKWIKSFGSSGSQEGTVQKSVGCGCGWRRDELLSQILRIIESKFFNDDGTFYSLFWFERFSCNFLSLPLGSLRWIERAILWFLRLGITGFKWWILKEILFDVLEQKVLKILNYIVQEVLMWMEKGGLLSRNLRTEEWPFLRKDGTFLYSFGSGQMSHPSGVVVDSFGSILVSDRDHMSVQLWEQWRGGGGGGGGEGGGGGGGRWGIRLSPSIRFFKRRFWGFSLLNISIDYRFSLFLFFFVLLSLFLNKKKIQKTKPNLKNNSKVKKKKRKWQKKIIQIKFSCWEKDFIFHFLFVSLFLLFFLSFFPFSLSFFSCIQNKNWPFPSLLE